MKLIIQIPCFKEEDTLPSTLGDLPREVEGFDVVEWLVIDDGSPDRTVEVAREHGVDHIVRLTNNKGLAYAFQAGLDAALKLGADVIVNTDGDNQYNAADIPKLVAPVLRGDADMVVGDREVNKIEHFSPLKKALQRLGSWVVRVASETEVPDTTSGFRAYNREAALQLVVVNKFTYTLETIIQAGKQFIAVDHVPIRTNSKTRESRLFKSMWSYVRINAVSIFRIYARYEPLRVFMTAAALIGLRRVRRLGPLPLLLHRRRRRGPRAVADPRRAALQRGDAAGGARRDRRPAERELARWSSASSSACARSSCSSARRRRTTSPVPRRPAWPRPRARAPVRRPRSARPSAYERPGHGRP